MKNEANNTKPETKGTKMMPLNSYDVILISTSGGKDSQAMMAAVCERSAAAGCKDKVRAVHAHLGKAEWPGTLDIVKAQCAHYNVPLDITHRPQNDLLDHARARGKWFSPAARYCTSDHKRGPIRRVYTAIAKDMRERNISVGVEDPEPIRILSCMGLRADESPARAKRDPFSHDPTASNGRRHVDNWLPIHSWNAARVWQTIRNSGAPSHPAYDLGMPRLSCVFCIFAPREALKLAGRNNPELLSEYVAVEREINHTFKHKESLADIQAELLAETEGSDEVETLADWTM